MWNNLFVSWELVVHGINFGILIIKNNLLYSYVILLQIRKMRLRRHGVLSKVNKYIPSLELKPTLALADAPDESTLLSTWVLVCACIWPFKLNLLSLFSVRCSLEHLQEKGPMTRQWTFIQVFTLGIVERWSLCWYRNSCQQDKHKATRWGKEERRGESTPFVCTSECQALGCTWDTGKHKTRMCHKDVHQGVA